MQSALSSICVSGISAGGAPLNVIVPTMSAARKTGVAAKVAAKRKIEEAFIICVVKFITRIFRVKRFVKFFTSCLRFSQNPKNCDADEKPGLTERNPKPAATQPEKSQHGNQNRQSAPDQS